jgi:hypothetical protein
MRVRYAGRAVGRDEEVLELECLAGSENASRLEGDNGPHAVAEEGKRPVEQGIEVPGQFTYDGREITYDGLTDPGLTSR